MKVKITYSYDANWDVYGGYWAASGDIKATGASFEEARERLILKLREAKTRQTIRIPADEEIEI